MSVTTTIAGPDEGAAVPDTREVPGWRLCRGELEATVAKIARVNERAARRGFAGRVDVAWTLVFRVLESASGIKVTEYWYATVVTGQPPCYAGWEFLAVLDWDGAEEMIVRPVPGADLAGFDRAAYGEGRCDHCGTYRRRAKTYVVRHTGTGEFKQVGRNCLADFMGLSTCPVILTSSDVDPDDDREYYGGGEPDYSVASVLALAWAVIQQDGYVRSSEAGATRDRVQRLLGAFEGKAGQDAAAIRPHATRAEGQAGVILEWLAGAEDDGGYITNLKIVARGGRVMSRNLGLLVSAPVAWARAMDVQLRERAARDEVCNEHVGQVGGKLAVRVRVASIRYSEHRYGVTTVYKMTDEAGHVFTWFSSSAALGHEVTGEWADLAASVKAHGEFAEVKETVLTRCKVLTAA